MNRSENKTVLLVEDNPMMLRALRETLKVLDYDTLEACNGREALEIIESSLAGREAARDSSISLIMSDLSMPEMDGQELFYELKDRGVKIPLIMLTGYVVHNELDDLLKDGLAGWLQKPADIEQISDLLEKTL